MADLCSRPAYKLPVTVMPPIIVTQPQDYDSALSVILNFANDNLSTKRCTILGLDTEWTDDNQVAVGP